MRDTISAEERGIQMDKNKITSVREEIVSTIQTYNQARTDYAKLERQIGTIALALHKAIYKKDNKQMPCSSFDRFVYIEKSDCIKAYVRTYRDCYPDEEEYTIPIYFMTLDEDELEQEICGLADKYIDQRNKKREAARKKYQELKDAEELKELERLKAKYESGDN